MLQGMLVLLCARLYFLSYFVTIHNKSFSVNNLHYVTHHLFADDLRF